MSLSIIHDYLDKNNFIAIDDYMRLCLQDENYGYYKKASAIGYQGDFITAPEISQIFGELIGVFFKFHLNTLLINSFQICELGGGTGILAQDYLRILNNHNNNEKIDVFFIESNEIFKKNQLDRIPNAHHITSIDLLPKKPTLFIANEFFDALPVKIFKVFGAEKAEIIIKYNNNKSLMFDYAPFVKNNFQQKKGFIEQTIETLKFCEKIALHIQHNNGAFLICDYGYQKPLEKMTFRGFKNHKITDGLQEPCLEDLTIDVNFQEIMDYFHQKNMNVSNLISQANFLKGLHIETRLHKLLNSASNRTTKETLIQGVQKLINPDEMGERFKLLCITKHHQALYPFHEIYRPLNI
jgi:SAM-dependent MidA family methyltransferase